ncbi:Cytochrome P450 monooxygenase [Pseudocercospora fuligena]|uniref:Cytochrome P450 monooxygenase n=1 Tax=Pseudocercospora fuligena TaxID=685502 RepID=A0A8H6VNS3_9PEZI|nr:Cytochrome P450 monooxygenase [Pseudocercospora fuligena]
MTSNQIIDGFVLEFPIWSLFLLFILLAIAATGFATITSWWKLRHIPAASFWAPFTRLWIARITFSGKQYWKHREWHQKYGPLVRIGPQEVVTDSPAILRQINAINPSYNRGTYYKAGRFNPYHDNLFTTIEADAHSKARARSSAAYSGRETPGLEQRIDEQISTMMQLIRTKYAWSSAAKGDLQLLDLGHITNFFATDVISRIGFGYAIGYLQDDKDHYDFLGSIKRLWPYMSTIADLPWARAIFFSPLFLTLFGPKPTDRHGFGALMGVAAQLIRERMDSREGGQGDMLESLLNRNFSEEECESEGLLILLAGVESTACALRTIWTHVITSPRVYSGLKSEIDDATRNARVSTPITYAEGTQLSYLRAVVYEGIRMRPPLLGLFPKVVPSPGAWFEGHFFPAGTLLCANLSALLQSPELFGRDAQCFRPERFTELPDEQRKEMERNIELVFGHGQWMCAGKNIAFMEMFKTTFELFRNFDVEIAFPFTPCKTESYGVFLDSQLFVRVCLNI